jgi:hypothetical protein
MLNFQGFLGTIVTIVVTRFPNPGCWMLDGAERPRFSREKIIISLVWQLGAASQLLIIMSYQSYIWVIYILHAYYCVIYIYILV